MKILGVIPARYASTRFPGKPLALIYGKSMIRRVYEQAASCKALNKVIVATDDQRIFEHVKSWGGEVMMTAENHQSGTDRCNEVLSHQEDNFDVVVNIQGDEPYIEPSQIEKVTESFANRETQISSLAKKIEDIGELFNANSVKVVIGENQKALYFSRAAIPFLRGVEKEEYLDFYEFYKHIGLYAYRTETLKEICKLPQAPLEIAESLEQLRWLSAGYEISMNLTDIEGLSVDTPEDLSKLTNKS
ncbi:MULTISPECIES: 3-deoxy-manno-octulosonate cytidylyltransferase [unclassified Lentimicrobium]|uniref:3-deoxy-manno-octulosonate cytidylyltransferase n=1 Tax=unclassified Lentimicrobium TaxID=2677434 RepID=UPI001551B47F|nr:MULTISPECIES: 3-deoxy-manno-octulosonate cytidylyltransferase [unclassified Lentimicrobium]NPD45823.1 3-deoxy-manno-octulosonate cytidylyltransferase [Lentimicrobium sp. S6]NPD85812.1 3-deoxy-manno-octulosonate cytidylyltransferase [Lentimicrobium sp. L6]